MAQLIFNQVIAGKRAFEIREGKTTLGRDQKNDIVLLHKGLSRRHAVIERNGPRVEIRDLASRNGTFVNGQRIRRSELHSGDSVSFGSLGCSFLLAPDAGFEPTLTREVHSAFFRATTLDLSGKTGGPSDLSVVSASARLHVLLQVSQILSLPEPVDRLLEKILDLAFQILRVDRAAILLAVSEGNRARILEPRVVQSRVPCIEGERIYSQRIVDYVLETGTAALFTDPKSDMRIDQTPSLHQYAICASMCAPLKSRDSVMGALYVDSLSASRMLSQEDLDLLAAFANQAAIAIENAMLQTQIAQEAVLRSNLLRFFPPAAIQKIMESKDAHLDVVEREVVALFCDISNFTSISSGMPPREVIDMLNAYFRVMAEIVFRHEGTLEKYIGDGILAIWGAPFTHPDDGDRAVRAAIEMQRALREMNDPRVRVHIGLNSGRVAAGNVGSERYVQYVTVGDTTNVASRICDAAGEGEILISEGTRARLCEMSHAIEKHDPIWVKGREEPLEVYRVRWDLVAT